MKAIWDSLVRTYAPWIVSLIVGWLTSFGIPLDSELAPTISAAVFLGAGALYYLVVRLLETYVSPKFGWLLGLAKPPVYPTPPEKI